METSSGDELSGNNQQRSAAYDSHCWDTTAVWNTQSFTACPALKKTASFWLAELRAAVLSSVFICGQCWADENQPPATFFFQNQRVRFPLHLAASELKVISCEKWAIRCLRKMLMIVWYEVWFMFHSYLYAVLYMFYHYIMWSIRNDVAIFMWKHH